MSYSPNPQRAYLAVSLIAIFFVCLVASCTPAIASDVQDFYKTETVRVPHTQQVCNDVYQGGDKTGDTLKGAIIGGMLGHSNSNATGGYSTQCQNITSYTTESRRVYSHSIIKFYHNGRYYQLRFQK